MEAKRAEALERLLDVAVRLYENGTLDLLENLSEISSEALSYLTDLTYPKVLRIWANIAYFLRFLIKATGEIRNLGIPMFRGRSASFSSARKWEYKRRGALVPPYFLFLQIYYLLDF